MKRLYASTAVVAALALAGLSGAAGTDGKGSERKAREAYGSFYKAVRARDLDGVMMTVDVPWAGFGDVLTDRQDLRKRLKKVLDHVRDEELAEIKIKEVLSYPAFCERFKKYRGTATFKQIDALKLTSDSWVILEHPEGAVFLRVREGKCLVAGRLR
jgi:hypothetical protein